MKILLFFSMFFIASNTYCFSAKNCYNLLKSMATFHYGIYVKYKNEFNFDEIIAPSHKASVKLDTDNNITEITDGKNSAIVLGGIPRTEQHLKKLKEQFNKENNIAFFSLNRQFERDWSGYTALFKYNNDNKQLFLYPTTDHEVPSFVDLLRAVRDLDKRDEQDIALAYIHCKAGRGRSALVVAAYLSYVMYRADFQVTPDQIERYLKLKRPAVNLNQEQRNAVVQFHHQLIKAGSLEQLLEQHQEEIQKRDLAIY